MGRSLVQSGLEAVFELVLAIFMYFVLLALLLECEGFIDNLFRHGPRWPQHCAAGHNVLDDDSGVIPLYTAVHTYIMVVVVVWPA